MSSRDAWSVFLVGRVALVRDGAPVDEAQFSGRQSRLTFAYLAAEQGRAVPRDELAEALWGEAPPPTWDKALTGIVSKLRALLSDQGIDGAGALTGAFGCYRLELPAGTWVDMFAAASAADEAEAARAAGDPERSRDSAALAESLLRQPFLPGQDGSWVEQKRHELADTRARALGALTDATLRSGDAAEAVKWAEQAIALSPFRETGYRRLMEAHVAAGDRAEALRVYERCRLLLAEELGAYPSPETEAIYRELLEGPTAHPVTQPASTDAEPVEAADPTRPARRRMLLLPLAGAVVLALAGIAILLAVTGHDGDSSASTGSGANAVTGIDASTGHTSASISLAASPAAVAYGEESVWVAMPNQDSVARIDPGTSTLRQTIPVGSGPTGIAVGGGLVWVANSLDGTISRIDPRANGGQVADTISVGNGPADIAFGLGGVWVANSLDRTVVRIDALSDKLRKTYSIDAGADALAVGDGAVWVTSKQSGV